MMGINALSALHNDTTGDESKTKDFINLAGSEEQLRVGGQESPLMARRMESYSSFDGNSLIPSPQWQY